MSMYREDYVPDDGLPRKKEHMTNALATQQATTMSVIPSTDEWSTIYQMAKALLPTGFLPAAIKTAEQATAIMLKGRELNVPPMYALANIVVVQGKPTVSAEMMLALVQRDHGLSAMWVEESTNDACKVGYKSGNGTKFYSFSWDDAKRAGVTKNPVWTQYPAAMCRARAISAVARMAFPGSIAGMYVSGELGDDVEVDPETQTVTHKMNATLSQAYPDEPVEVIDPDGVIEDTNEHDDPDWLSAANYLAKLVSKYKITNDEGKAMLRKWGVPSAKIENMSTDQLRKACEFIDKRGDSIKAYVTQALADEQELAEINQMPIEV